MALQSSPPISLQDILTEFNAPAGTPLTSMVRGGAYVPNNSANAAVPTAAPISVLDFLGASNIVPATVLISPAGSDDGLSNGVAFDGNFTASVLNGVGPFTYSWSCTGNGFSVINPNSATCTLHRNGASNIQWFYTLSVLVTDIGNSNVQCSDSTNGSVTWGTPP